MALVATAAAAFSTSVPTSLTDEPILPKLQAVDGHCHQSISRDQLGVESPPAGAAVGPGASRNAHVAVDVGLGHALLTELVGLDFGGAAGWF